MRNSSAVTLATIDNMNSVSIKYFSIFYLEFSVSPPLGILGRIYTVRLARQCKCLLINWVKQRCFEVVSQMVFLRGSFE